MNKTLPESSLWSIQFSTIIVMTLSFFVGVMLLTAGFPAHITTVTKNPALGGLMTTVFMITAIITRPIVGFMIAKVNLKVLNIFALVFLAITVGLSYGEISINMLLGLRGLHGIAFGILSTCMATMATNIIPAKRLGEGIGFYGLSTSGGTSFAPMIALAILQYFSYNVLIATSVTLLIVTLGLNLTIKPEQKALAAPNSSEIKEKISFMEYAFDKRPLLPCILILCFSLTLGGVISFMKQLSATAGLEATAPLFFLVMAVVMMTCKVFAGFIYDRMGHKVIIYPAAITGMIALFLISTTTSAAMLLAAGVLYGITYGALIPPLQTLAVSSVEKKKQGTANAMYFTFMDLGMALGAALLGILAGMYGYRFIYSFSIGLLIMLVVLYTFTLGMKAKKEG